MNKKTTYIIAAAAVLVVLGGVALYFTQRQRQEAQRSTLPVLEVEERAEEGLGSQLYENPAGSLPETNPFGAETNPLTTQTNPFEGGYVNPF